MSRQPFPKRIFNEFDTDLNHESSYTAEEINNVDFQQNYFSNQYYQEITPESDDLFQKQKKSFKTTALILRRREQTFYNL